MTVSVPEINGQRSSLPVLKCSKSRASEQCGKHWGGRCSCEAFTFISRPLLCTCWCVLTAFDNCSELVQAVVHGIERCVEVESVRRLWDAW